MNNNSLLLRSGIVARAECPLPGASLPQVPKCAEGFYLRPVLSPARINFIYFTGAVLAADGQLFLEGGGGRARPPPNSGPVAGLTQGFSAEVTMRAVFLWGKG